MTHATISKLLLLIAVWLQIIDEHADALLVVLVALTLAVLRLTARPGWLSREWTAAVRRHSDDSSTLFEGRRDDA
jgi:hypothetical protein